MFFFLYRLKAPPEPIQIDKTPPCDNSNKVRSSLPSPSRIISSVGRTAKITEVIIDSDSDDSFEEPISTNANSNSLTDSTIVRTPFRLFNPHTQGNLLRVIDNKAVKDREFQVCLTHLDLGLNRTWHMSLLTGQDQTAKFAGPGPD